MHTERLRPAGSCLTGAMTEPSESRVAVYIDFDNIVVSRYNQLYGRSAFQNDRVRNFDPKDADPDAAA